MTQTLEMPKEVREASEFNRELSLDHLNREVFIGLTREESEEYLFLKLAALSDDYWIKDNRWAESRRIELLGKIEAARVPLMMEVVCGEQG